MTVCQKRRQYSACPGCKKTEPCTCIGKQNRNPEREENISDQLLVLLVRQHTRCSKTPKLAPVWSGGWCLVYSTENTAQKQQIRVHKRREEKLNRGERKEIELKRKTKWKTLSSAVSLLPPSLPLCSPSLGPPRGLCDGWFRRHEWVARPGGTGRRLGDVCCVHARMN